jgi:hypothetical protein
LIAISGGVTPESAIKPDAGPLGLGLSYVRFAWYGVVRSLRLIESAIAW